MNGTTLSRLEENPESAKYFATLHESAIDQKTVHDRLKHVRQHKERQLHDLLEQLVPDIYSGHTAMLKQREASLIKSNLHMDTLIGHEDLKMHTYEYMRLQRATMINANAAKYKESKDNLRELTVRLKERATANKLLDKELEGILKAEQKLKQRIAAEKYQREELVRDELGKFRSHIEVKAFFEKARINRDDIHKLKGKERVLELLEEAFNSAKEAEVLDLRLNGHQMKLHDIEKGFLTLKKVTHADTAEQVVHQYEEVVKRREGLEALETNYEAEIEAKKAELSRMKTLRTEDLPSCDIGNLVELEATITHKEAICTQQEIDLKRLNETVAQVTNGLHQLYAKLKVAFPLWQDTKLTPTRLSENYQHLDALMNMMQLKQT